jgi:chlorophyll a/b binding light-harvesting protein PcbE
MVFEESTKRNWQNSRLFVWIGTLLVIGCSDTKTRTVTVPGETVEVQVVEEVPVETNSLDFGETAIAGTVQFTLTTPPTIGADLDTNFFGVACIWFVEWARIHGIYDPAIGAVRQVEYNLNLTNIWNHQFDFLAIDSLEDVMGGHAFLAFVEITGGAFHIATKQTGEYTEFKGKNILSAEAVLSWSLAGIGWMAIIAAFWCATNTTVYPEAWYGETLALKFGISPYWIDTADMTGVVSGHTSRAWLANVHYYLGFFFIQGHLWHAIRALGFDFKKVTDAISNLDGARVTLTD